MNFGIRPGVRRLLRPPARHDSVGNDMDEELRFHLEARIEHLVARGMSLEEAHAAAFQRLGTSFTNTRNLLHHSARTRERRMRWHERVDEFFFDVRYAARRLIRRPGFTVMAVLTLAIGIGANTTIFAAVNTLLLRPLPFREPERLMEVSLAAPSEPGRAVSGDAPWSFPKFRVFREGQRSYRDLALWSDDMFNLTSGESERVGGETVSARYLATLGVNVAHGHDFPADEQLLAGAPRIAIVSDALWQRRFNADPSTIGRTLDIDGEPYEIVGVLPPSFRGLSGRAEVLLPISTRSAEDLSQAWSLEFSLVARLKPGATTTQAAAEAKTLGKRVYDAYPMRSAVGSGAASEWSASARPLGDTRVAPAVRRSLLVLAGAVAFVLLICCVNLANLLLGRAAAREREMAVRRAIGAGRARLVRLLLTESLLLSLIGGVASFALAWWGTKALSAVNPQNALQAQGLSGLGIVSFSAIRLDLPALGFALAIAVLVGALFGLVPALELSRDSLQTHLKGGSAARHASAHGFSGRRLLVVTEVALAIVLLVGAGLMLQSLRNRLRVDAGFNSANLLTLRLNLPQGRTPRDSMPGFYRALLERMRGLPGVEQAALADCPPLNGGCNETVITFPDRPAVARGSEPGVGVHVISPEWFRTMEVPLKRGRLLTDADLIGTQRVIVISEAAARAYWPGQDPLGTRAGIWQGGFQDGATVVGVVGDVRFGTIDSLPRPDVYMSYNQSPRPRMMIFLRTQGDPLALTNAARGAAQELSGGYPVYDVRSMASRVAAATTQARLSAVLLALFAGAALALAFVGIYGVLAFAVVQRTREIGIRMALGARREGVIRLILGEGLLLAGIGGAVGLVTAYWLTRVLRTLLYDVAPTDPATYVGIAVLVMAAAALASWIPARRAARVDPNITLRAE